MANYTFPDVVGVTLTFDPATDRLLFPAGYQTTGLRLEQDGTDVLVHHSGLAVRLGGVSAGALSGAEFFFASGAVVRYGTSAADSLSGSAGDDAFHVDGAGNDSVAAGDGNDRIDAGQALRSGHRFDGGAGTDTLVLSGGYATTVVLGPATVTGIEVFLIDSAPAAGAVRLQLDAATLSTASAPVFFDAGWSEAGLALDGHATTTGFSVRAGRGTDTLTGGAGADTLEGGEGADLLTGGAGDDRFVIRFGCQEGHSMAELPDTIGDFAAGDRLDFIQDFEAPAHLAFHAQALDFDADSSGVQDALHAEDGLTDVYWQWSLVAQRLQVWVDTDDSGRVDDGDVLVNLATAGGKTLLVAADFANALVRRGTADSEQLTGGTGDDVVAGDGGDDTVAGGNGADFLFGNAGRDRLYGGAGDDSLRGGAGNDTLDGGDGANDLDGGEGNDTYLVRTASDAITESGPDGGGTDRVLSYVARYTLDPALEHGTVMLASGGRLEGNVRANAERRRRQRYLGGRFGRGHAGRRRGVQPAGRWLRSGHLRDPVGNRPGDGACERLLRAGPGANPRGGLHARRQCGRWLRHARRRCQAGGEPVEKRPARECR
ncbi:MAG TPA: calcium-binding protein [Ramlibacter sp.]